MLIVCATSGTVLSASNCYILDDYQVTDEFFDTDQLSDSEFAEFAKQFGTRLTRQNLKLSGQS